MERVEGRWAPVSERGASPNRDERAKTEDHVTSPWPRRSPRERTRQQKSRRNESETLNNRLGRPLDLALYAVVRYADATSL